MGAFPLIVEIAAILPVQYIDMRRAGEVPGERRLLLAVLEDAISCVRKYGRPGGTPAEARLFDEAQRWITGRTVGLITFQQCCEVLGADPTAVARAVFSGVPRRRARKAHEG